MFLFPAVAPFAFFFFLLMHFSIVVDGQDATNTDNNSSAPPASVYCVSNAPALSWPSASLPDVERVAMPAGTQLVLGPEGLVSLRVAAGASFHAAVLRLASDSNTANGQLEFAPPPNATTTTTTTILDCGNRATGLTTSNAMVLEGTLMTPALLAEWLPLLAEVTVVLQNDDTAIRYSYAKVMLEAWMWEDAVRTTTSTEEYVVTESSPTMMAIEWGTSSRDDAETTFAEAGVSSFDRSPWSWKALGRLPLALVMWFFALL